MPAGGLDRGGPVDVLSGGGRDSSWADRLRDSARTRRARLARGVRRHPSLSVAVVGLLAAGSLAGWLALRPSPEPEILTSPMSVEQACRLVAAYRDADTGGDWLMAKEDLRGVLSGLDRQGTADERAVRRYADATLGPPTAGPARYLEAADASCRRAGVPLLIGWS